MRKMDSGRAGCRRASAGFSLLELMIAVVVFGIISAAAFSLVSAHQPIFNQQQNQAALNIAMRNAIAQIQVDMVNGGSGYYSTTNIPNWPVSVVINNNVIASTGDCHSGTTYGSTCFDSFVVIASDANTTPVNVLSGTSGALPVTAGSCTATTTDTSASNSIYVLPPTGVTATTYANNFNTGDQILLEKGDGSKYTTVKVTGVSTPTVSGTTYVLLSHSTETASNGTNAAGDDVTGMSVNSSDLTTSQFCPTDWLIRLDPVEFDVDTTTNAASPTLRRTELVKGQTPSANGIPLMTQIIGFKIGASLVNSTTSTEPYDFDASTFTSTSSPHGYDYTLVRSVMVSIVGRTTPNPDPTYVFRNSFDGGPYQIQGATVIVNPRNADF